MTFSIKKCIRFCLLAVSWFVFITEVNAMAYPIPVIDGDYITVYQPAGDVFTGPPCTPLEAGRFYADWVVNDHCFVQDANGTWHIFGITHPESGLENVHAGEYQSFHAVAPAGKLSDVLHPGSWKDAPKILAPHQRPGEIPENHAPCIMKENGVYHMVYGPAPIRHATSTDLFAWTPCGPLTQSLITRDPALFDWNGTRYLITCGVSDVRMATLTRFDACTDPRVILSIKQGVDPESPTLIHHAGTFYLFVCDWDNVWDKKELKGAYQHITRVYQSDDPFHFDSAHEVARLDAHAPEIIRGEDDSQWFISSAEYPRRGISIAPLRWTDAP